MNSGTCSVKCRSFEGYKMLLYDEGEKLKGGGDFRFAKESDVFFPPQHWTTR